jgi:hypothetical protein
MKRGTAISASLLLLAIIATRDASSQIANLDWADEFVTGRVNVKMIGSSGHGTIDHFFDQNGSDEPPTWTWMGGQGANQGGRANAREKVMTSWYEGSSSCFGVTINLARRRVFPVPGLNQGCNSGQQTPVGSVSYTKNSCVFPAGDWDISMRAKPVFDFALDTSLVNQTAGYVSTISSTSSSGMAGASLTGCYAISWF